MKRTIIAAASMLLFAACERVTEQNVQTDEQNVPAPAAPANATAPAPALTAPEPGTPGGLPDDRTPLSEPQGPIDPKSAEAAGQVVQKYGALIEQRRIAEAAKLWGSADSASDFAVQLKRYPEAHLQIGKPGDMEGAAGSSYVTVPVVFYGKDQNDKDFHRAADVILRRVNDVPGSTEAQRRWHIERIEWKS